MLTVRIHTIKDKVFVFEDDCTLDEFVVKMRRGLHGSGTLFRDTDKGPVYFPLTSIHYIAFETDEQE